jgi:hypothetical protein
MDRLPAWLRWILVLPAAAGSFLAIQIVVALLHTVAEYLAVLTPLVSAMGDYFPQLVNSVAGPYAFVWAGTRTSPAHRLTTAISLAVIMSVITAAAIVLVFLYPNEAGMRPGGLTWLTFSGVLGIGTAIKACLDWR